MRTAVSLLVARAGATARWLGMARGSSSEHAMIPGHIKRGRACWLAASDWMASTPVPGGASAPYTLARQCACSGVYFSMLHAPAVSQLVSAAACHCLGPMDCRNQQRPNKGAPLPAAGAAGAAAARPPRVRNQYAAAATPGLLTGGGRWGPPPRTQARSGSGASRLRR